MSLFYLLLAVVAVGRGESGLAPATMVLSATAGLGGGLAHGLMRVVNRARVEAYATSPVRSFRGGRAQALVTELSVALAFTLTYEPVLVLSRLLVSVRPEDNYLFAWLSAMAAGLVIGLPFVVGTSPWAMFGLVAFEQARRLGRPWRLMGLLADCYRLGLLRTVGPVYQFRHAELQDHLASGGSARASRPAGVPRP